MHREGGKERVVVIDRVFYLMMEDSEKCCASIELPGQSKDNGHQPGCKEYKQNLLPSLRKFSLPQLYNPKMLPLLVVTAKRYSMPLKPS